MDKATVDIITKILRTHLDSNENKAFIFGSRADGTAQKYSDYDIGIEGKKLEDMTIFELNEEFENSDLPYLVDIVDFNTVSENFRSEAKSKIIELNL